MSAQTLDITYRQVCLAQGNADQNQHYPPFIFDLHYNIVTSFILEEGAKVFGVNQFVKELLKPFIKTAILPVKFGQVQLPEDYLHYTGASVFVKDAEGSCPDYPKLPEGEKPTDEQLKEIIEKSRSVAYGVSIYEVDEYDRRTDHPYKKPTLKKAIACIEESNTMKVSPYDIPFIKLKYIRQPKRYRYGYGQRPNDTFYYDPKMEGAVETEWTSNADATLFKGVNTLYSIYARDGELRNANLELKKVGLF